MGDRVRRGGGTGVSGGLLYGRTVGILDCTKDAEETLFEATRADKWTFSHRVFKHCTFANVSFLKATLDNCTFLNCAFLDCYFRRTEVVSSVFTGCKFEDCTFTKLVFVDATFEFSVFRGCFIEFKEFHDQLPADPGKRFNIADELAREAAAAGASRDARLYRLEGANAYEDHLRNIALASGSSHYRDHFDLGERLDAAISYCRRKFNRFLWGYGERGWVLTRNFLLVGAIAFPLAFWLFVRSHLSVDTNGTAKPLRVIDYVLFSFDNLLNRPGFSDVAFSGVEARILVGAEVLVGLLFIGLFISLIFNWIRRR